MTKNFFSFGLVSLISLLAFACSESTGQDEITSVTPVCEPQTISIGPNNTRLVPVDIEIRGACNESLAYSPEVSMSDDGVSMTIFSNSIPNHRVGLFGGVQGSLNPHAIAPVNGSYAIPASPILTGSITPLWNTDSGPEYELGILLNGVILDPEAAEPFPHKGFFSSNLNMEWNLDAMMINLGLDCNNAHVQPSGKYHYHGAPTLYLESLNISSNTMTLVGYAADGFPIYYKYGYSQANDENSNVQTLSSSYRIKSGERPGDGVSAPCGAYNGVYTNDWEYIRGLGELDECNGREGVTPEYPDGTYYYVITDDYPFLPRCLRGIPSTDFRIGR